MELDPRDVVVFSIPMRMPFRRISVREGVLLRGPQGWGEFSPFLEYPTHEAVHWLRAAVEAASEPWPAPRRKQVPVNVTVPAVGPEQAAQLVRESGCQTAKVKVAEPGQTDRDDEDRVAAVRDALGAAGRVRIDANGAWSVSHAQRMIKRLNRYDLEYVEQPCQTIAELAELRRQVSVPIAADESIRRVDDPLRVVKQAAADIVVLKVQPLGGVVNALRIAELCGLPTVVSSAVETSVGLAAGLALAAALPELPYACGLGTASLLAGDVVRDPLLPIAGQLPVRLRGPGSELDPDAVAQFTAPPDRANYWRDGLAHVWQAMESGGFG